MKALYIFLSLVAAVIGGYLVFNDFSFDNVSFSNYLITAVLILLLSSLAVAGVAFLVARKRKTVRDVMTIRQYYQYKSAR